MITCNPKDIIIYNCSQTSMVSPVDDDDGTLPRWCDSPFQQDCGMTSYGMTLPISQSWKMCSSSGEITSTHPITDTLNR